MKSFESPELVRAMGYYELLLGAHPEVVPSIGFTVLQRSISVNYLHGLAKLDANLLVEPVDGKEGLITVHRRVDPARLCYSITLLNRGNLTELPHLSRTIFEYGPGGLSAETKVLDSQGRPYSSRYIDRSHVTLTRQVLESEEAAEQIRVTQDRREFIRTQMDSGNLTPAELANANANLKHLVLK